MSKLYYVLGVNTQDFVLDANKEKRSGNKSRLYSLNNILLRKNVLRKNTENKMDVKTCVILRKL